MDVVIRLKCVSGCATWTGDKARLLLLGNKVKVVQEVNEDDSVLVWRVSGPARFFLGKAGILARVSLGSVLFKQVFDNKHIQARVKEEDREKLRSMLIDQSEIEFVRGPSLKEWKDSNTPFYKKLWEKWFG